MPISDVDRFDKWSATYDRSLLQRLYFGPVHARMLDLLAREWTADPPRSILDVGCGTGRLLRAAGARWPHAQLFGVDPAHGMVAEAGRLNPCATFEAGFAESLPFADQFADIVLSSISFHHWADQTNGMREIARVLRPGGFFCLADHTVVLSALFGEKPQSRTQVHALMAAVGLTVRKYQTMPVRFVLITVAER